MNDGIHLREANGLLFIGDPHLTSIRPGRRKDVDFGQSVLSKIDAAIDIANERRLIPVFTGDMFDVHKEEDQGLITRLIRSLSRCWTWSISNVGNHDMQHTSLSDGDSMAILKIAGVLAVITQSGPAEEFLLGPDRRRIGLGMTPYGQIVPTDVSDVFPDAEMTVWCTHHDLLFRGAYSGSAPLHEIAGCRLVINGHLHIEKPHEIRGATRWINPGNITRMSVDVIDHVPAVLAITIAGNDFAVEKIEIPDPPGLFDLTGYNVAAVPQAETARVVREEASAFVELLRAETTMEMNKSEDGALLREEIERKCEVESTPAAVKAIVLSLLDEAVHRGRAA